MSDATVAEQSEIGRLQKPTLDSLPLGLARFKAIGAQQVV